ncbi:MAG: hypothetical protein V4754_15230 [Pseudomonadota bacterium]
MLTHQNSWTLMPASGEQVDAIRARCRQMVRRRAAVSAAVSALPLPGLDLISDLSLFARLIDEVNHEFGLTPEQIERLHPKLKLMAYQVAAGMGGAMVGKLASRQLLLPLLRRGGVKMAGKQATRLVPLAGQVAAAAIGFAMFRQIGYQHVDACAAVARRLLDA